MNEEVELISGIFLLTSEARQLMGKEMDLISRTFSLTNDARQLMGEEVEPMSSTFSLTNDARQLMGEEVELTSGTLTLTSEARQLMSALPMLDRKHGALSGTTVPIPINQQPLHSQQTNLNVHPRGHDQPKLRVNKQIIHF
ncbi:hypothetical protein [Parapedobacter sp. 2B3]|uniref:hypothetical protein n=1 Tax=Parapedobacter sp. 2B3 TaxID=3342381 RepID=UPI0035B5BFE3